MTRGGGWPRVAGVLTLTTSVAGCGWFDSSPRLQFPGGNDVGAGVAMYEGVSRTEPATYIDSGLIRLCLDSPGDAVVEAVRFADATGPVSVAEFVTLPVDGVTDISYGDEDVTLEDAGWDPSGPQRVSAVCSDDQDHDLTGDDQSYLIFRVVAEPADLPVRGGMGLNVDYRLEGDTTIRTLELDFSYAFCESSEACDEWREAAHLDARS